MKPPFFSIVMPVYNREKLIGIAVESVLQQTFVDWELIIIDDGSTDNTKDIIKGFKDERIKYHYQVNQERSIARNNGISKAKGEFICFLDSDDYYLNNHLQSLHDFILKRNCEIALYATGANVDRGSERIKLKLYEDTSVHPVRQIFYHKLDMNTTCTHNSIFLRFKFDPSLTIGEDTHLWLRIVLNFPFYQVPVYSTVTVNHDTSGMVAYYRDADLNLLRQYVRGAKQLFKSVDLSRYVSRGEQRMYISKKYRGMAFCCIWARKMGGAFVCAFKAAWWTPSFIFSKEFLKFIKESVYMIGRIILRKKATTK
jgi:glycosyltransferase involved in cell wall biosynthesis